MGPVDRQGKETSLTGKSILNKLLEIFGEGRVSWTSTDRLAYSRDLWPRLLLEARSGTVHPQPAFVVWPETTEEISALLSWAQQARVPVTPWGGGSGVCGAALPAEGGIVLDTKRMERILSVDPISLTVTCQTGILGQHLEEALQAKGLTLGHFPSSLYCSTAGGWLATRSAGQLSSRYGKIEDMVIGVKAVLPDGRVIRTGRAPRSATGPNLVQLLLGSEGTLAVITEATLAVNPLPEAHLSMAFVWDRISAGLDATRRIIQAGLRPAVVRLYDELDTGIALKSQGLEVSGCLLLLRFEGHPRLIQAEADLAKEILEKGGGKDLGPGPAEHWWQHRYSISYQQSPILSQEGTFLDTIEVAATWDRLETLYCSMREALAPLALVMAHFSHVYPQGASVYFTVVGKALGRELQAYDEVWRKAMETCVHAGGTISHHHGVGRLKAPWMGLEHGEGLEVMRAIKRVLDPSGILNPGNMGL